MKLIFMCEYYHKRESPVRMVIDYELLTCYIEWNNLLKEVPDSKKKFYSSDWKNEY